MQAAFSQVKPPIYLGIHPFFAETPLLPLFVHNIAQSDHIVNKSIPEIVTFGYCSAPNIIKPATGKEGEDRRKQVKQNSDFDFFRMFQHKK
jgi:hypothetical protein